MFSSLVKLSCNNYLVMIYLSDLLVCSRSRVVEHLWPIYRAQRSGTQWSVVESIYVNRCYHSPCSCQSFDVCGKKTFIVVHGMKVFCALQCGASVRSEPIGRPYLCWWFQPLVDHLRNAAGRVTCCYDGVQPCHVRGCDVTSTGLQCPAEQNPTLPSLLIFVH